MLVSERTLIAILVAFGASVLLTPLIRRVASEWKWLDEPNHRTSHAVPVPRVGGVAFILSTALGVGIALPTLKPWVVGVALGALLLAFTGFLDDLRTLRPLSKLTPQVVAAAIAVVTLDPYIYVDLPFGAGALHPLVSRLLAVVWIVAVINAFNFIDGLDGLAAGIAAIAAVSLAVMADGTVVMVLLPFAAAMGGFLVWNLEPASIFMGDVGSQFVGYVLAVSVFMPVTYNIGAVPVLLVFSPVLVDALVTLLSRMVRRQSVFLADRNHLFHGIARRGYRHRTVASLYYALTAAGAISAVLYTQASPITKTVLLILAAGGASALTIRLVAVSASEGAATSAAAHRISEPYRSTGHSSTSGPMH